MGIAEGGGDRNKGSGPSSRLEVARRADNTTPCYNKLTSATLWAGLPAAVVTSALISDRMMYYQAVDDHYCVITAKEPYVFYISFFGTPQTTTESRIMGRAIAIEIYVFLLYNANFAGI